jgi:hypothetical protein
MDNPSYKALETALKAAYAQAAEGKGKERHANGKAFERQPIMEIARMVGPGYQIGQAMKKGQEAMGMHARGETARAQAELLGAINYMAAAWTLIGEVELAVAAAQWPKVSKGEAL